MKETLLKTFDYAVTRESGIIRIQPRARGHALVGVTLTCLALILFFPGRHFFAAGLGERICWWTGAISGVFAVLFLSRAAVRVFFSPDFILNSTRRMAKLGKAIYPIQELSPPVVEEYRLNNILLYKLTMVLGGQPRVLIDAVDEQRLNHLREAANAVSAAVREDPFAIRTETPAALD